MLPIPETFVQTQIELNGAVGHAWVERLPAIVDACARRWDLTLEPSSAPLSYNYVVPARRADGTAVIVKACAPAGEFAAQAAALRIYDGHGSVRLLELDRDDEVMLLERCEPGTPLLAVEDEEKATSIAAATMRQLWRPIPLDLLPDHPFPSVADWARGLERLRARFDGGTGPFPTALVAQAERLFTELIASMDEPVVLTATSTMAMCWPPSANRGWLSTRRAWSVSRPMRRACCCAIRCRGCSMRHIPVAC